MSNYPNARISIELVPRSYDNLDAESDLVARLGLNTINIPDLQRMDIRSWQACGHVHQRHSGISAIPHIRSIDFSLDAMPQFAKDMVAAGLDEVVLITGDPPVSEDWKVYPTSPLDMIEYLRQWIPGVRVYGAVDPYRSNMRDEANYIARKIEAGFDGYFTQPFFDLRLMDIYAELLEGQQVYWGISPVVAEGSRNYWERKNLAVFPKSFAPDLRWNIDFAREALAWCGDRGDNAYLMPIRVPLEDYLLPIFA